MAEFIVRVVLRDTKDDSYEYATLHASMEVAGFKRSIIETDGVEYHLPPGEYCFAGNVTGDQVKQKVMAAAEKTGKEYCLLVSVCHYIRSHNLTRVKKFANS